MWCAGVGTGPSLSAKDDEGCGRGAWLPVDLTLEGCTL